MKNRTLTFFSALCIPLLFLNWFSVENNSSAFDCVVELGEDISLALGDSYQMATITTCDISNVQSIAWTPSAGLSCSDCLEPIVSPLENVCYTIMIVMQDGCTATDEICIDLPDCAPEYADSNIDEVSPETISDTGDVTLTIARTQYVHLEILEDDEVQFLLWEGWLRAGVRTVNVDFAAVPTGSHELRAKLYPENKFITIQKN